MERIFSKLLQGYRGFREKYALGDNSVMQGLAYAGQKPEIMVVACCDSRVDPALILQCDPGDLFVVRNVANIVPPYEPDGGYHGTSAALEFGICVLEVKHLILLGHSQCGGIQAVLRAKIKENDFVGKWVSLIRHSACCELNETDALAKCALERSWENCLSFPWIKQRVEDRKLQIHRWFFDISTGCIHYHDSELHSYMPLPIARDTSC